VYSSSFPEELGGHTNAEVLTSDLLAPFFQNRRNDVFGSAGNNCIFTTTV
jgi:hypothetical protein